jgi:hypothetical protein
MKNRVLMIMVAALPQICFAGKSYKLGTKYAPSQLQSKKLMQAYYKALSQQAKDQLLDDENNGSDETVVITKKIAIPIPVEQKDVSSDASLGNEYDQELPYAYTHSINYTDFLVTQRLQQIQEEKRFAGCEMKIYVLSHSDSK